VIFDFDVVFSLHMSFFMAYRNSGSGVLCTACFYWKMSLTRLRYKSYDCEMPSFMLWNAVYSTHMEPTLQGRQQN